MIKKRLHVKDLLGCLLVVTVLSFLGITVKAQSLPTQENKPVQENDTTRKELAQFDQFLDRHREIAEQLRKDPSLVNNREFVEKHPPLQTYLREHQGIREEIRENPNAFMRQEDRFDRREGGRGNDTTRKELAQFDQFLDRHREIAEQLRKDPSRVDNREFVDKHAALKTYLQEHPGIREEITENPNAFMHQEDRFDRREDGRDSDAARRDNDSARRDNDNTRRDDDTARRDNDATPRDNDTARRDNDNTRRDDDTARRDNDTGRRDNDNIPRDNDTARRDNDNTRRDNDTNRRELARFDQFSDSHREIAEQLRKDPTLVNNREFVEKHPALKAYMQDHPGIREEIKENPNAFMRQENRFDRHEDARDNDTTRGHLASFGEFLGGHSSIAQQVSKDPSLVKNDDFVRNHPELQEYLNAHPGVREEMRQNPQTFVKSAQQFSNNNNNGGAAKIPAPTADTKPKL